MHTHSTAYNMTTIQAKRIANVNDTANNNIVQIVDSLCGVYENECIKCTSTSEEGAVMESNGCNFLHDANIFT